MPSHSTLRSEPLRTSTTSSVESLRLEELVHLEGGNKTASFYGLKQRAQDLKISGIM